MNGTKGPAAFSIVNAISLIVILGYVSAVPLWMWYPPIMVPPETLAIINQMMGAFGMAFATVISFHLGSSRSSKDKDDAQNQVMSNLTGTGGALSSAPAITKAAEKAAGPAAEVAAPPAAAEAAPPAAEKAVDKALNERFNERDIKSTDK